MSNQPKVTRKKKRPDSLQSFLYELMRDHLPTGKVERIVRHIEEENAEGGVNHFEGRGLAQYAKELAERIRGER